MTVLLVLATFILFLVIDYFFSRRTAVEQVADAKPAPLPRRRPEVVAGFQLPENFRYHPGHTWAVAEAPQTVRIGMDDLAARFVGKGARIELPKRGQWLRQGQRVWSLERDGRKLSMVSPIEGMVTDVNEAAAQNPELLRDPYGDGWLVTVNSPDAATNFRNLLGGVLARRWMEEAARRLRASIPQMAGALAQDGGLAISDLGEHLTPEAWTELSHELFLY
jgi:glycine cleavage system H lipoate-binding protein